MQKLFVDQAKKADQTSSQTNKESLFSTIFGQASSLAHKNEKHFKMSDSELTLNSSKFDIVRFDASKFDSSKYVDEGST